MLKLIESNVYWDKDLYSIEYISSLDMIENSIIVLVPDQYTLQAELDLLELLNVKGLFNIEVMSIKRLMYKFLNVHSMSSDFLNKLALVDIVQNKAENLNIYSKIYKNLGFFDNLYQSLEDFRRNRIEPESLKVLSKDVKSANKALSSKIDEISLIFADYLNYLDLNLNDYSKNISKFITMLNTQNFKLDYYFVVEGFASMSKIEIQLLSEIAKVSDGMSIRIVSTKQNNSISFYSNNFKNSIIKEFTENDIEIINQNNYRDSININAEIFDNIFSNTYKKLSTDELESRVSIVECKNIKEEIHSVLQDIFTIRRSKGLKWSDFAILSNSLVSYQSTIKNIFDSYDVPYFIDAKRPAKNHYCIGFIFSIFDVLIYNFKSYDIIKLLKSRFVKISYDSKCKLENLILEKSISGYKIFNIENYENDIDEDDFEYFIYFINELKVFREKNKKEKSNFELVKELNLLLEKYNFSSILEEQVENSKKNNHLEYAEELSQIYNIVQEVFEELSKFDKNKSNLKAFYELLKYSFDSYDIGIIPPNRDNVFVGDFSRSKLGKTKKLYCINFNEGVVPSVIESSGLFNFREIELLNKFDLGSTNSIEHMYSKEVYNIFLSLLKSDRVQISYSIMNTEFEIVSSSLWIDQITSINNIQIQKYTFDNEHFKNLGLKNQYFESELPNIKFENELHDDFLNYFKNEAEYKERLDSFKTGKIEQNNAKLLVREPNSDSKKMNISVSRVEKYAKCPYSYFVEYMLKPKKRKEARYSALDIGSLFHDIFEKVMNSLFSINSNKFDYDKASMQKELNIKNWELRFEDEFNKVINSKNMQKFKLTSENQFSINRLKDVLRINIQKSIEHYRNSAFVNMYNEVVFGNLDSQGFKISNFEITSNKGYKLSIRGKIDRVDIAKISNMHYIRIVDYKTGSSKFDLTDLFYGLSVQLLLYLKGFTESIKKEFKTIEFKVEPYGVFYFNVQEPRLKFNEVPINDVYESGISDDFNLSGIMLDDIELNENLDERFKEENFSTITKLKKKKDGTLMQTSMDYVYSNDELESLLEFAKDKVLELSDKIYTRNIEINPYKHGDKIACEYCNFSDICRFDESRKIFTYNLLQSKSREEILDLSLRSENEKSI